MAQVLAGHLLYSRHENLSQGEAGLHSGCEADTDVDSAGCCSNT